MTANHSCIPSLTSPGVAFAGKTPSPSSWSSRMALETCHRRQREELGQVPEHLYWALGTAVWPQPLPLPLPLYHV